MSSQRRVHEVMQGGCRRRIIREFTIVPHDSRLPHPFPRIVGHFLLAYPLRHEAGNVLERRGDRSYTSTRFSCSRRARLLISALRGNGIGAQQRRPIGGSGPFQLRAEQHDAAHHIQLDKEHRVRTA